MHEIVNAKVDIQYVFTLNLFLYIYKQILWQYKQLNFDLLKHIDDYNIFELNH